MIPDLAELECAIHKRAFKFAQERVSLTPTALQNLYESLNLDVLCPKADLTELATATTMPYRAPPPPAPGMAGSVVARESG